MKQTFVFSFALLALLFCSSALFAHEHEDCAHQENCDHQENCVDLKNLVDLEDFAAQEDDIWFTGSVRAMLCSSCGFGSKKDNCVLCGKWIGGSGVPACICGNCGFGSKKDNCVKCGKWRGGN